MAKPVALRRLAVEDVESAVDRYADDGGPTIAGRFIDAVDRALRHVGRHPHTGSLRFSYELELPGLRAWPVPQFPYVVFYVERSGEIDVWRILHTRRDLPASFAQADGN